MGFDPTMTCDFLAAGHRSHWKGGGALLMVFLTWPPLENYDMLVVPGGPGTLALPRMLAGQFLLRVLLSVRSN